MADVLNGHNGHADMDVRGQVLADPLSGAHELPEPGVITGRVIPPVADDVIPGERKRLPVVPEPLRRENIRGTITYWAGLHWHRFRYHSLRFPWYVPLFLFYAARGACRLNKRVWTWWHWTEGWHWESLSVAAGRPGYHDGMRAHVEGKKTRASRGRIVAGTAAGVIVLALAVARFAPLWGPVALVVTAFPFLVRHGRPAGKPLLSPAVVDAGYQKPTLEIISKGLASVGIKPINDLLVPGARGLDFLTDPFKDGEGWCTELNLPHGVTAGAILKRREELASGLRRPLSAVWPEGVPAEHEGRLKLWIGFTDMAKMKPKPWPLAKSGKADVFAHVPFGTDPRGRSVTVPLFEVNWLIGAAPGNGKTAAVRVLALAAALDPLADLWVHELAGKGDLEPLAQVCHRYTSGLDEESIAYTAESLQILRADLGRRSAKFKEVPKDQRPDGKITRELAKQNRLLRPRVCIIDECFPAGTPVGTTPIEKLTVGDVVPSWDEATGLPCDGIVTTVFKSLPHGLVRIRWADGSSLVCTPGHPFMTNRGWQQAAALDSTSEVLAYGQENAADRRSLLDLRDRVYAQGFAAGVLEGNRAGDLLAAVPSGGQEPGSAQVGRRDGGRPGVDLASHEGAQSDVRPAGPSEGGCDAALYRTCTEGTWRQWPRPHGAPATPSGSSWLGDGGHREDRQSDTRSGARPWYPGALQAGYRQPGTDGRRGSGRRIPLRTGAEGAGSAQGRVAHWHRVDRVEVLEPGSDGRYGGLCPDGHVYNIEVAGTHTYLVAGGLVAHNCQNLFADPEHGKQAADDAAYVIRLGRAYGIILILSTQRPNRDMLPTDISGNVTARFCLKVPSHVENDLILGTSAHANGYKSTVFRAKTDAGLGWLKGDAEPQIVKTYYLDEPAARRIAARARAMREQAGVLSGYALAEDADDGEVRDVRADLAAVLGSDRGLHWGEAAERLADQFPSRWAGATADSVSAEARDTGIPSVDVRRPAGVAKGVRRQDVTT